jgi:hypothetical protein
MRRVRLAGLRVIAAGYGSNPNLPGQVAHQLRHEFCRRADTTRIRRRAVRHQNLSAPTYQRLHRELDENQFLEFCMLVCHYVMAAMMLDVAGCEVEPAFRPDSW